MKTAEIQPGDHLLWKANSSAGYQHVTVIEVLHTLGTSVPRIRIRLLDTGLEGETTAAHLSPRPAPRPGDIHPRCCCGQQLMPYRIVRGDYTPIAARGYPSPTESQLPDPPLVVFAASTAEAIAHAYNHRGDHDILDEAGTPLVDGRCAPTYLTAHPTSKN